MTKYFQYRSICIENNRHDKCGDHHNFSQNAYFLILEYHKEDGEISQT